MLNVYPDSMGGTLGKIVKMFQENQLSRAFSSMYILPSLYHSDLDRGFCVVDYDLNQELATEKDLEQLSHMGVDLKLDFVMNHASVMSPQFQDLIQNGKDSVYQDFFINWNKFWENCGKMTEQGFILPSAEYIKDMFFRKPGLPILMVQFPDGTEIPYWNTFYQNVWEEDGKRHYLGQMDLNIKSSLVWDFYEETLEQLSQYGAKIIRLDAFAYAPKEPGAKNFMNEPGTWELLEKIQKFADRHQLNILPEIHASYGEGVYEKIACKGYMTYDFFLPGLIIDALETGDGVYLKRWAEELKKKNIQVVNMLGCHDGIPLLDLKGFLPDERIQCLIDTVVSRGGYVKDLHGSKNIYYQVNATYYSALGEDEQKLLLARAIQLFMPGKPQVWYLDLFAGKNDYEAVKREGEGGHKEINRTNLDEEQVLDAMKLPIVQKQIELLQFRNSNPAFAQDAKMNFEINGSQIKITWRKEDHTAILKANLDDKSFEVL